MEKVLERNTDYVFEYAIIKDNNIWLYNDYDSYRRGFSLNDGKSLWKPKIMIDENNLLHIIGYEIIWYYIQIFNKFFIMVKIPYYLITYYMK